MSFILQEMALGHIYTNKKYKRNKKIIKDDKL